MTTVSLVGSLYGPITRTQVDQSQNSSECWKRPCYTFGLLLQADGQACSANPTSDPMGCGAYDSSCPAEPVKESDLYEATHLCDGSPEDCDDVCCTRIDFCEILDLMNVMSQHMGVEDEYDSTISRETKTFIEEAKTTENNVEVCRVEIVHNFKLKALSQDDPIASPLAPREVVTKKRPEFNMFMGIVFVLFGAVVGGALHLIYYFSS